MKTVIFSGSGFSKAIFDQKIQRDLLNDFLNSPESRSYIEFLPKDLVSLIQAIDDIELIMSHYLNLGYSGLPHKPRRSNSHQKGIIFFRMALAIYFREKFIKSAYSYYEDNSKKFVEDFLTYSFVEPEHLVFISTNYDLGLEKVVEEQFGEGSYYYPGFEDRPPKKIAIPILKLHGSINWLEDRGAIDNPGFENSTRQKKIYKSVLNDLTVLPFSDASGFTLQSKDRKYTPIMTPFFHQKSMWYEINKQWWGDKLDEIWKLSFEHLSSANQVFFWGYGLPSADYHMFSFLSEAMGGAEGFCKVVDLLSEDGIESNLIKLMRFIYRDNPENLRIYKQGLLDHLEWYFET